MMAPLCCSLSRTVRGSTPAWPPEIARTTSTGRSTVRIRVVVGDSKHAFRHVRLLHRIQRELVDGADEHVEAAGVIGDGVVAQPDGDHADSSA